MYTIYKVGSLSRALMDFRAEVGMEIAGNFIARDCVCVCERMQMCVIRRLLIGRLMRIVSRCSLLYTFFVSSQCAAVVLIQELNPSLLSRQFFFLNCNVTHDEIRI